MSDLSALPENVDRLSRSDLEARYSIKGAALYNRLDAVGLKRNGSGRPAYFSREQTQLLDDLHTHIQRDGRLSDFPHQVQQNSTGDSSDVEKGSLSQPAWAFPANFAAFLRTDVIDLITGALIKAGSAIFPPPLPPAKRGLELAYLRELEEAYRGGWQLSTENLANLLGLQPKTVTNYGDYFEDAGFTFTVVGKRKDRQQYAWKVGKPNQVDTTTLD
jgi:hypothetical protein